MAGEFSRLLRDRKWRQWYMNSAGLWYKEFGCRELDVQGIDEPFRLAPGERIMAGCGDITDILWTGYPFKNRERSAVIETQGRALTDDERLNTFFPD